MLRPGLLTGLGALLLLVVLIVAHDQYHQHHDDYHSHDRLNEGTE